jgi:hypothetical protein
VVPRSGDDYGLLEGFRRPRSQPDGWYAPLDDFSKQAPTCNQMAAGIACPDVERLWIPVCLLRLDVQ